MKLPETVYAPDSRSPDTWSGALGIHARVVGAVIMRDLQTRLGSGYWGYLLSLFMPLGHLGLAIVIYGVMSRGPGLGSDVTVFLTIAVMPFVIWFYTHRQMFLALHANRALLHFPGVTVFDLLIGRAIVEICTNTLIAAVVVVTVTLAGHPLHPFDLSGFVLVMVRAYLLGVATGLFMGALGFVSQGALLAASLLGPLYWVTSGTLFLSTELPNQVQQFLVFLPLTHIVDEARLAYYSEYTSDFSSVITADMLIFAILSAGIYAQHAVRRYG